MEKAMYINKQFHMGKLPVGSILWRDPDGSHFGVVDIDGKYLVIDTYCEFLQWRKSIKSWLASLPQ